MTRAIKDLWRPVFEQYAAVAWCAASVALMFASIPYKLLAAGLCGALGFVRGRQAVDLYRFRLLRASPRELHLSDRPAEHVSQAEASPQRPHQTLVGIAFILNADRGLRQPAILIINRVAKQLDLHAVDVLAESIAPPKTKMRSGRAGIKQIGGKRHLKPIIKPDSKMSDYLSRNGITHFHVSLTDDTDIAMAFVVLERSPSPLGEGRGEGK